MHCLCVHCHVGLFRLAARPPECLSFCIGLAWNMSLSLHCTALLLLLLILFSCCLLLGFSTLV